MVLTDSVYSRLPDKLAASLPELSVGMGGLTLRFTRAICCCLAVSQCTRRHPTHRIAYGSRWTADFKVTSALSIQAPLYLQGPADGPGKKPMPIGRPTS